MTTIILSILGILLAAAAALMIVFYGGEAFTEGSVSAHSNTLENAGANVLSASMMYRLENGTLPTSLSQLVSGGRYLQEEPDLMGIGSSSYIAGGYFDVIDVSREVCLKVVENLAAEGGPTPSVPAARDTGAKMGCFDPSSGGTPNASIFYVKL